MIDFGMGGLEFWFLGGLVFVALAKVLGDAVRNHRATTAATRGTGFARGMAQVRPGSSLLVQPWSPLPPLTTPRPAMPNGSDETPQPPARAAAAPAPSPVPRSAPAPASRPAPAPAPAPAPRPAAAPGPASRAAPTARAEPAAPGPAPRPRPVARPPAPSALESSETIRIETGWDGRIQLLPGRLEVVRGAEPGREFRFLRVPGEDVPEFTVGRSSGPTHRHIQIAERTVSRLHARLWFADRYWRIANLSLTNPVRVNGQELTSPEEAVVLGDGDRIQLGDVELCYRDGRP